MSQPELISLLVFGTTDTRSAAQLGFNNFPAAGAAVALNAFANELQRSLTSANHAPDIVEIRPGYSVGLLAAGAS